MRSPKFKFLAKELSATFSPDLLEEEWKKRVSYQVRKQLVFDVLEYRDYREQLPKMIENVRSAVLNGSYKAHSSKRYLVEKSRGLCRQMTLVHPRDLLVLERLSRSLYIDLQQKAPSKSAFFEPDDGNFKSGFQQYDFQYGSFASWKRFQKQVFGFSKENKFIVVTDVANFYDFINFNHLRNIVAGLADVRESVLDLLIYLLNRLTWLPDYMPLSHVGMPQIETSATRVLANAMLYEVDKVCEDAAVLNYARFMDDIDVGVSTIVAAKEIVRDIDLSLQSRQLRLNSSKTKILSQKGAFEHFCIVENEYLAKADKVLEKVRDGSSAKQLVQNILVSKYNYWLDRTSFDGPGSNSVFLSPNGSKVHKYILRLIYKSGAKVSNSDLIWLINKDPSMRSTAFIYLATSSKPNDALQSIHSIYMSGTFVDDASLVNLTGFLLHARFRKTAKSLRLVSEIIQKIEKDRELGAWSAINLAMRFYNLKELVDLIERHSTVIGSDYWLSRAAGGVFSRVARDEYQRGRYLEIVKEIDSKPLYEVTDYLMELTTTNKLSNSSKAYMKAPNITFPQQIYFPKVLIVLALSHNPKYKNFYTKLKSIHKRSFSDPFYIEMGLK